MFDWQLFFIPLLQTLYMVLASGFFASLIGIPLGIVLFTARSKLIKPMPFLYRTLNFLVSIGRSVPFIILMIALIPFTRMITGTSIGTTAAIVPLTVCAIPFLAKVVENILIDVPVGLIEASLSMGSSTWDLVKYVLLPEALPALIQGITLMTINLISYSAMAGAIGGGGLGDLAIRYGYQRFNVPVMIITIIILVLLVQLTQMLGDKLVKQLGR